MTITEHPTPNRTWEGVEIPIAGTYDIDASHSRVGFAVRHLMVSKVRGQFTSFDATVTIGEDPTASQLEVTIDAGSVDTRDAGRDGHLTSPDFFDVAQHPQLTYRSSAVRHVHGNRFAVDGDLTVRGVTRPVTLDLELEGVLTDPWGNARAGFTASAELDREAFGLTWNQALESGGVVVGKKVSIEIEAEIVRRS